MKHQIHTDGSVTLEAHCADDLSVVNGARVSFAKKSLFLEDSDEKLIEFLMRERHGSPFEHNYFRFHIKCPIFVAREWFRHRIGSFNEMSMRYHEPELEFYLPDVEYFRTQVGKPGSYSFEPLENDGLAEYFQNKLMLHYEDGKRLYDEMIARGVAKELARIPLPVATYTEFYWSINARSLMNFISLRNSDFAQKEIRDYAIAVEDCFSRVMPVTHRAFVQQNRVAV